MNVLPRWVLQNQQNLSFHNEMKRKVASDSLCGTQTITICIKPTRNTPLAASLSHASAPSSFSLRVTTSIGANKELQCQICTKHPQKKKTLLHMHFNTNGTQCFNTLETKSPTINTEAKTSQQCNIFDLYLSTHVKKNTEPQKIPGKFNTKHGKQVNSK